jgi:hypothetical protein
MRCADAELAEQARDEKAAARRKLDAAVRRAYQHISGLCINLSV